MIRLESQPAFDAMIRSMTPDTWESATEISARLQKTFRLSKCTIRSMVYRAHELGQLQAAVLEGRQATYLMYADKAATLPDGAVKVPAGLGPDIGQFVNVVRYGSPRPHQRKTSQYRIASRDHVLGILEDANRPMTVAEIAEKGQFRYKSVQNRLYKALKFDVISIHAKNEPVRYAVEGSPNVPHR